MQGGEEAQAAPVTPCHFSRWSQLQDPFQTLRNRGESTADTALPNKNLLPPKLLQGEKLPELGVQEPPSRSKRCERHHTPLPSVPAVVQDTELSPHGLQESPEAQKSFPWGCRSKKLLQIPLNQPLVMPRAEAERPKTAQLDRGQSPGPTRESYGAWGGPKHPQPDTALRCGGSHPSFAPQLLLLPSAARPALPLRLLQPLGNQHGEASGARSSALTRVGALGL